jgi:hypothetical protein
VVQKYSIAETTQNQGGQGGTGVQGIDSAIEKKINSFSEEPSLEKFSTVAFTGVLEGGQYERKVDSCTSAQDMSNYEDCPHLTCDTPKAAQCELPLYQRADGQIEVDHLAITSANPKSDLSEWMTLTELDAIAPSIAPRQEDNLSEWMTPEELQSMAADLDSCEDAETLALFRKCWLPEPMNAACKLLSPEKHAQIKQWVIELNSIT